MTRNAAPSTPHPALTEGAPALADLRRLVIVDDDPSIACLVRQVARNSGYEAVIAKNGADVLRLLQSGPVHLLVTDIYMPDTDGLELIHLVRTRYPQLRIVAMSGGGAYGFCPLKAASLLGAECVIEKPFDLPALAEILRHD